MGSFLAALRNRRYRSLAEVPVFDIKGPWFHLDNSKYIRLSVKVCTTGTLTPMQHSSLPLVSMMHFVLPNTLCSLEAREQEVVPRKVLVFGPKEQVTE